MSRMPKSKKSRQALRARCGVSAFMQPSKLGYPVVPARSRDCKPTCDGAESAYKRGAQQHHPAIRDAAKRLGARLGCPWAKGGR